ncbi:MAG TPA: hypothetical protein VKA31_10610 [Mariprofundaceae bacterium]|jgi:hypothetical protein|nr:hypothetical protein [Mariprofundaceae bacterium]
MKEEGDFRGETFAGFMLLNDEGAGNTEPGMLGHNINGCIRIIHIFQRRHADAANAKPKTIAYSGLLQMRLEGIFVYNQRVGDILEPVGPFEWPVSSASKVDRRNFMPPPKPCFYPMHSLLMHRKTRSWLFKFRNSESNKDHGMVHAAER